jgi:glutamyl-Q tRNA(Asp) synthetase
MAEVLPIFRFAPSPNGLLHRGHALSALTNERFARSLGGRLLLRIEDIDPQRSRPEFEAAILRDLAWLGIRFDGDVLRQSQRMAFYEAALARLTARGLVYPCLCSRQDIRHEIERRGREAGGRWPRDPDGAPLYPGTCREAQAEGAVVRRLRMDRAIAAAGRDLCYIRFDEAGAETAIAADPERWGDIALARRDVPTSYHLSVVVDDAAQAVTHVVRGRDLEAATDIHVLLQRLLGLPTPRYHFHRLLHDEDGRKLAKSRGSPSLADLRGRGVSAARLRAEFGF